MKYFLLTCLFVYSSLCVAEAPRVVDGLIDLSEWNFERDGVVNLTGDWEFFWSEFLDSYQLSLLTTDDQIEDSREVRQW